MDTATFHRLAILSFGKNYVYEIARHYGMSTRMIRNYKSGDCEPNCWIASDLLEWSEPDGWKKRMIAKAVREIMNSIPNEGCEEEACGELSKWVCAKREVIWAAKAEREEAEQMRQAKERLRHHRSDVRHENRCFRWHRERRELVEPLRASTPAEAVAFVYAASGWDPS